MFALTYIGVSYLTLFSVLMLESGIVWAKTCTGTGPCSCQFDDGTSIDLTPLSSSDVNNPTFMDISGPTTLDIYSWNPCADFSEGPDDCKNVAMPLAFMQFGHQALPSDNSNMTLDNMSFSGKCGPKNVCDIHQNIPNAVYFSLGNTDSVTYTTDDLGQVTINYQYKAANVTRNSHILLTCDQSQEGTLVAQGPLPDPSSPDYYFGLTSKYICQGNSGGGSKSSAISVGTIICIGALVLAVVYLVGGVSINVFVRNHIGVERIPNASFWLAVPGLIKDGCKFVLTRGKSTTYDRI